MFKEKTLYYVVNHTLNFFILSDVAVIDKYGYGQIVGRMKDMIIRGGENIYPRYM